MQLSSIPQLYRNAARLTDIATILSRYGLADLLAPFQLDAFDRILRDRQGTPLQSYSREERIRLVLTELGPTFIKIGQILSTRPDIIGQVMAEELKKLQSNVPADPPEQVRKTVETEMKQTLEEAFERFEETPLASASIGQVHLATLHSGEEVVVKVQHPGISSKIKEDLEILGSLAALAENLDEFKNYQPVALVEEFRRTLERELDFTWELRNLLVFRRNFAKDERVHIPHVYPKLTTQRVLVMERIRGTSLKSREQLKEEGFDLEQVAADGADIFLKMIFTFGTFHADPHPGNFLLLPNNIIGLIDFGMVGRLSEEMREDIENMLLSIVTHDAQRLSDAIVRLGSVPTGTDLPALRTDVSDFVSFYGAQSLDQLDISAALNEMMEIVRQHQIILPPQIGMLIKVLITLEGTSRLLNPNFNLIKVLQPYQKEMLERRLSPKRQMRRLFRLYDELARIADVLPKQVLRTLEQMQAGKFKLRIHHGGFQASVNRLAIGMIASALFVGSSLLLSFKVPPLMNTLTKLKPLQELSFLGVTGLSISIFLSFKLMRAIGRAGHLDGSEE